MQEVKKAVVAVAGMGTRFFPITKSFPKEMLPIVDKPILSYILDEAINSGIEEIILIISDEKELIRNYYDRNEKLEKLLEERNKLNELEIIRSIVPSNIKISYVVQDKPLGTAYAINLAKDFINNEPFAIIFGDDIVDSEVPVLKQMLEYYKKYDCNVFAAKEVDRSIVNKYGILKYKDFNTKEVECIVEKPSIEEAPSNFATIGRYIVKPEVFEEIKNIEPIKGEYVLTSAFERMMAYQKFYACEFEGKPFDTGNKLEYIEATINYALKSEYGDKVKEFIKKNI